MPNELQIFNSPEFGNIRAMEIDGEPWLVGKDVAAALGYAKPENAIASHVAQDDKTTTLIQGTGSNYKSKAVVINESGLYSLILSSKLPGAKKFKRWVTSEVLPAIRKTGGYIPADGADDMEILSRAILIAQKTIEEKNALITKHEAKIAADAPAVAFAKDVGESQGAVTVEKFAKMTFERFGLGRNKLHAWLRENRFLTDKRVPFQKYIDNGWFRTFEELRNGYPIVVTTITGKGQRALYGKLSEAFPSELQPIKDKFHSPKGG